MSVLALMRPDDYKLIFQMMNCLGNMVHAVNLVDTHLMSPVCDGVVVLLNQSQLKPIESDRVIVITQSLFYARLGETVILVTNIAWILIFIEVSVVLKTYCLNELSEF